jgi:hypothetical protein
MHRTLFHNVLGARAGGHTSNFCTNAFPHDRGTERPSGNCPCVNLDDFMTGCVTYRGFALDHEFAAHQNFGSVGIFMPVQKFSRYGAAEIFDLLDLTVNCLLEYFIDHFKIARKIGPLETAWQVDKDIKCRDEDNRALIRPADFHQFFDIFYSDPGQVDANIGGGCLDIREIARE